MEEGFVWDEFLDRAVRRARRAATRGIGPARQSASLDLPAAAARLETLPAIPHADGVPVGNKNLIVAGAFWMLRELELSSAIVADITVVSDPVSVAWRLPVSKTDVRALGQCRKWDCLCAGDRTRPCPAHAVHEQIALLKMLFGEVSPQTPLFPDRAGEVVQKRAVVAVIENVASLLGEPLTDEQGQRRFGGHSLRVTGARHLAAIGLDISLIQLMARWSSDVVFRYVADAPLQQISRAYLQGQADTQLSDRVIAMQTAIDELRAEMRTVEGATCLPIEDCADQAGGAQLDGDGSASVGDSATPKAASDDLVQNSESHVVHYALLWSKNLDPAAWRTRCGWRFAGGAVGFDPSASSGTTVWCKACLKALRQTRVDTDSTH